MFREDFGAMRDRDRSGREPTDCNMIFVTVQSVRTERDDHLRTQFADGSDDFLQYRWCALTDRRSDASIRQIEKAKPAHIQYVAGITEFALAYLPQGFVIGQRFITDRPPLTSRRTQQSRANSHLGIMRKRTSGRDRFIVRMSKHCEQCRFIGQANLPPFRSTSKQV